MDNEGKKTFVADILSGFRTEMDRDMDKMPENWDGKQLRQYMADKFVSKILKIKMTRDEMKEYRDNLNNSSL